MKTLNEVFSSLSTRRRYEAWFARLGLANGGGAFWFRYLLLNPGRCGCPGQPQTMPVQVWATWFEPNAKPQSLIQEFPLECLDVSPRGRNPFHFRVANNAIKESSCRGGLEGNGHTIAWDLQYRSTFHTTLSDKGWIGFSRTPHSDARFEGRITLDGRTFEGDALGFGVQGHNCGYRHRSFWIWAHTYFLRADRSASTLEALVYDMPLGLVFRKAVLYHDGRQQVFRGLREIKRNSRNLQWDFRGVARDGFEIEVSLDGGGSNLHRLPYMKTDCTGRIEVANNSLARASLRLTRPDGTSERLVTSTGAVLEMGGRL